MAVEMSGGNVAASGVVIGGAGTAFSAHLPTILQWGNLLLVVISILVGLATLFREWRKWHREETEDARRDAADKELRHAIRHHFGVADTEPGEG